VGLAAGTIMLFMWVVIYQTLRPTSNIVAWIDWSDSVRAVGLIALIGLGLTLIPTLLMTRKYLKV
jgi:cell division transport system permease protein